MPKDYIGELLGNWASELCMASAALRILLGIVLSAVIGYERSSKRHSAGLRTFMIVTLASVISMLLDCWLGTRLPLISAAAVVAASTLSGNSILFSSKGQIKGITTSAGLWTCSLIGLALGAGLYTVALFAFAALFVCFEFFPRFEKYLKNRSNHFEVHLELKNRSDLQDFVQTVRRLGMLIDDIESNPAYLNSGLSVFSISLVIQSEELKKYKTHKEIIEALRSLDYVSYIEEIV